MQGMAAAEPAVNGAMPQGAGLCGDRGGLIKWGPRRACAACPQSGLRRRVPPSCRREPLCAATEAVKSTGAPAALARWGIRPLSTGGKWTERPPGGLCTKSEMPPGPPVRGLRGWFLLHASPASAAGLCFSSEEAFPVLPPYDEGGGKPGGLDGGRDTPGLLRSRIHRAYGLRGLSLSRLRRQLPRQREPRGWNMPLRAFRHEKKHLLSQVLFWRRRRDLNPCDLLQPYSLSRGAPSPLGYFSIALTGNR